MKVRIGNYPSWVGPYQLAEYFRHLNIFIIAAERLFTGVMWCLSPFFAWSVAYYAIYIHVTEWLEKQMFDEYRDDRLHKLGEFFAHGFAKKKKEDEDRLRDDRPKTWLYKLCEWIHSKQKRKIEVHVDRWDSWNVDSTLSPIILPLLKQLKATKHGSGYIDLEDVPEDLRYTETEEYDSQYCFEFYHDKDVKKKECDVHARYEWALDEMIWAFEQLQPDYDWEEQYRTGEMDIRFVKCEDNPTLSRMVDGPNHTYVADYEAIRVHQERINRGLRLFGKYYQTLWD